MKQNCFPLIALLLVVAASHAPAEPALWDLKRLSKPPQAEWGKRDGLLQKVWFHGEPYKGKPTRVFAWVGRPVEKVTEEIGSAGPQYPAMVLVHGGGGRAFAKWAEYWAKRGYVAIAMDTAGNGSDKKRLPDGGPSQHDQEKFREFTVDNAKDMWTYHAVADVILAHSLIRSMPEVDADRTGLTGISWGGYLTCITAGVDTRFKAAVPVYGCGFLGDNSVWSRNGSLGRLKPQTRQLWLQLFDPSSYVGNTRCPIMFLNGTNDFAYHMDSHRKTMELVDPKLLTTAIQVNLRHGHIWTFGVVDAFIDSKLRGTNPLVRVGEVRVKDNVAFAPLMSAATKNERFADATLVYSNVIGNWPAKRPWKTAKANISGQTVSATLPTERPIVFFFQVKDQRAQITSSMHVQLTTAADEKNIALVPMPKLERDFYDWYKRHNDVLLTRGRVNPEVVLVGDSITHLWGGLPHEPRGNRGADSWKALFGNKALNLGFGWDRIQNVLWRLDHGEMDGLNPKHVVIHIGTNNLAGTKNARTCTPAEIAAGIKAVVKRVQTFTPKAHIILMAVFPRGEKPDNPARQKIAEINRLVAPLGEQSGVTFLDITNKLINKDGVITRDIMRDFLHPAAKGYQIWADALRPIIGGDI